MMKKVKLSEGLNHIIIPLPKKLKTTLKPIENNYRFMLLIILTI